jgi:hypothetical protein
MTDILPPAPNAVLRQDDNRSPDTDAISWADTDSSHEIEQHTEKTPTTVPGPMRRETHMGLFILLLSSLPTTGVQQAEDSLTVRQTPQPSHFGAIRYIMSSTLPPMAKNTSKAVGHSVTLSFLTLKDLIRLRGTSKAIGTATTKYVKVFPGGDIFVRWPMAQVAPVPTASLRSKGKTPAFVRKQFTSSDDSASDSGDNTRLFLGQLRRQDTVLFVVWMVAMLLPQVTVSHMDNHTNPRDPNRGRGCAWLYTQAEHEPSLLALNKRVLIDQDPEGPEEGEGFWIVPNNDDSRRQLAEFSDERIGRDAVLPRRALVVEVAAERKPWATGATPPPTPVEPYTAQSHHARMMNQDLIYSTQMAPIPSPPVSHHYAQASYGHSIPSHQGPTTCFCAECQWGYGGHTMPSPVWGSYGYYRPAPSTSFYPSVTGYY